MVATQLALSAVLMAFSWTPAAAQAGTVLAEQKISHTEGGFGGPLGQFYEFGTAVVGLGDLDGDCVSEIAVGAPRDPGFPDYSGSVWILFLDTDGTVKSKERLAEGDGGFQGDLEVEDQFGYSLANLGDLDGDGVVDLAVGSTPFGQQNEPGSIWVVFLNADGTAKDQVEISQGLAGFEGVIGINNGFGISLTALGDLTGDGTLELAAGTPGLDTVWILSLDTAGVVQEHSTIGVGDFPGLLAGTGFGNGLAAIGDLDGNGVTELAVGAPGDGTTGTFKGATWVLFLDSSSNVVDQVLITENTNGLAATWNSQSLFGFSLAGLGDLDGDLIPDLGVGAYGDDEGGPAHGALWVLFLNSDGTVRDHEKINSVSGGLVGPISDLDLFGRDVEAVGDVNGDGRTDIVVGAHYDDDGGSSSESQYGAVYVLFLDGVFQPQVAEALDFDTGDFIVLNPGCGTGQDPSLEPLVAMSNQTGPDDATVTVTQTGQDLHPDTAGFGLIGTNLIIETTLLDGQFSMALSLPFQESDLGGADPTLLDLAYFDPATMGWQLAAAGNTQNSPGHSGPVGDRFIVMGTSTPMPPAPSSQLGDYGVFVNTDTGGGYAWANVDHTTDFAVGIFGVEPYGCGVNPAASLAATGGSPSLGGVMELSVDDPPGSSALGSQAFLAVALSPDPSYPCGTTLPGFGMSGPTGELLIRVLPPDPIAVVGPASWAGSPTPLELLIPGDAILEGLTLHVQGLVIGGSGIKLAGAVRLTLRAPCPRRTFPVGYPGAHGAPSPPRPSPHRPLPLHPLRPR